MDLEELDEWLAEQKDKILDRYTENLRQGKSREEAEKIHAEELQYAVSQYTQRRANIERRNQKRERLNKWLNRIRKKIAFFHRKNE